MLENFTWELKNHEPYAHTEKYPELAEAVMERAKEIFELYPNCPQISLEKITVSRGQLRKFERGLREKAALCDELAERNARMAKAMRDMAEGNINRFELKAILDELDAPGPEEGEEGRL